MVVRGVPTVTPLNHDAVDCTDSHTPGHSHGNVRACHRCLDGASLRIVSVRPKRETLLPWN